MNPEYSTKKISRIECDIFDALPYELTPKQRQQLEKYIHQEFKFQQAESAQNIAKLVFLAKHSSTIEELRGFIKQMISSQFSDHFKEDIEKLFALAKNTPPSSIRKCKQFCLHAFEFKEQLSGVMKNRFSQDEIKKMMLPEIQQIIAWRTLQRKCHEKSALETEQRIWSEKPPTEEEVRMGIFREELEWQVRDAVFAMNRKGYRTVMSGFNGRRENEQYIDGFFEIDPETMRKLNEIGVHVAPPDPEKHLAVTTITFRPAIPDMKTIKSKWDEIAALLPDLGHRSPPSPPSILISLLAPDRFDLERERLEYELSEKDLPPEYEKELQGRLAEVLKKSEGKT